MIQKSKGLVSVITNLILKNKKNRFDLSSENRPNFQFFGHFSIIVFQRFSYHERRTDKEQKLKNRIKSKMQCPE